MITIKQINYVVYVWLVILVGVNTLEGVDYRDSVFQKSLDQVENNTDNQEQNDTAQSDSELYGNTGDEYYMIVHELRINLEEKSQKFSSDYYSRVNPFDYAVVTDDHELFKRLWSENPVFLSFARSLEVAVLMQDSNWVKILCSHYRAYLHAGALESALKLAKNDKNSDLGKVINSMIRTAILFNQQEKILADIRHLFEEYYGSHDDGQQQEEQKSSDIRVPEVTTCWNNGEITLSDMSYLGDVNSTEREGQGDPITHQITPDGTSGLPEIPSEYIPGSERHAEENNDLGMLRAFSGFYIFFFLYLLFEQAAPRC